MIDRDQVLTFGDLTGGRDIDHLEIDTSGFDDAEARKVMQGMRWQAGTLFRALDQDGDGILSEAEIEAAPDILASLAGPDGYLREAQLGGTTLIPGRIRLSGIVRLLDIDGTLEISPADIRDAVTRIWRLDRTSKGYVEFEDDLPDLSKDAENRMPMGTPKDRLAFQRKIFTRALGITGPMPPAGVPAVQAGYLLLHEVNDRGDTQKAQRTYLMDEYGKIAHMWASPNRHPEATNAYLLETGQLLRTTCKYDWVEMDGRFPIGANGTLTVQNPDDTIAWEWSYFDFGVQALHHDMEQLPNGNFLVISWHCMAAAEAQKYGWKQQGDRDLIILDKVLEVKPDLDTGGADIVWEWHTKDHFTGDADPKSCYHKIDVNWPYLDEVQFNSGQVFHSNSISYDPEDDVILLSSAVFGEIWAIDHSTTTEQAKGSAGGRYGKGGDLIWRWGNPQTHSPKGPEDQVLYWQHDAHYIDKDVPHKGDVLVFNNGMRRAADGRPDYGQICMGVNSNAYSDVLEITLPRDENHMLIAGAEPTIEWSWNSNRSHDFYSPFMSGARRMPNGNTLMVQGSDKRIVEVTADGQIVLDFHLGGPARMFRIYKYAPDHPGILNLFANKHQ